MFKSTNNSRFNLAFGAVSAIFGVGLGQKTFFSVFIFRLILFSNFSNFRSSYRFVALFDLFWGLGKLRKLFWGLLVYAINLHFISMPLREFWYKPTLGFLWAFEPVWAILREESDQKTVFECQYSYWKLSFSRIFNFNPM